jgi:hypothetical protein
VKLEFSVNEVRCFEISPLCKFVCQSLNDCDSFSRATATETSFINANEPSGALYDRHERCTNQSQLH